MGLEFSHELQEERSKKVSGLRRFAEYGGFKLDSYYCLFYTVFGYTVRKTRPFGPKRKKTLE